VLPREHDGRRRGSFRIIETRRFSLLRYVTILTLIFIRVIVRCWMVSSDRGLLDMTLWSPGPHRDQPQHEPEVAQRISLTPAQIVDWIRSAGFRAQAELTDTIVRIDTGLAGYGVAIHCYAAKDLDQRCDSIQFLMGMNGDETVAVAKVRLFVNDFNARWRFVTVSTNDKGDFFFVLDFLTDETTTTALFARYFQLFDTLLQDFRQRAAAILYS
jgi:hypothetical protein